MAKLQEHFQMDYKKILPPVNSIIKGKKFRITILSELLVRLEYSETGEFEDRPTELVMSRKFPSVKFEAKDDNTYLTISTSYFNLFYRKEMPFESSKMSPDANLKIELTNTDKVWYYKHPEVRNFGGTAFSLDGANGKAKYAKGLYSVDGFVSLDDSTSLIFNEDGSLGKRSDTRIDTYVFMYRRDFGACLKDYFTLTGYPPLIPRYALGNWWNRNIEYNAKGIEMLVHKFSKNRIPLSVIMLGDYWHRQNVKMKSGLSFDERLFKRPKRLTDFLHGRNIRMAVKINPSEGINPKEDYYLPFKAASGLDGTGVLPFNVFNVNVLSAYFDYFIHPLMNYGVDFFWLGYNNANDLTTLRTLTHYHFDDFKQIVNRRGIVFARNGLVAPHRYPIHYTGETVVSWKNLEMMPEFNAQASNIGVSWISNDIGGFMDGTEDGELFSRFVQFGCFSPILRLSADQGRYYKREPWKWDIQTQAIVARYLQLRHQLIPYLYSEAYRYHKIGLPLVEPLYYQNPEIYDEPLYKNEYYFGSSLLVAPITTKKDPLMSRTVVKLALPEGTWYDITNGKKYSGGRRYTTFYKDEDYPVFAHAGTILPMAILDENDLNNTDAPRAMEIQVFPGDSCTYELYEDDGISSLYEKDFFILTEIDYTYQKNNVTISIRPVAGKSGIIPPYRSYRIRFRNMTEPTQISVTCGPDKIKETDAYLDDNDFVVELPPLSTLKQITLNCKGDNIELDSARLINDDLESILNDLPIQTKIKNTIGEILLSNTSIQEKRIAVRKLSRIGVNQKYVNLFIKLLEYMAEV